MRDLLQNYLVMPAVWHESVLPLISDVWVQLEVPSWEIYQPALQTCTSDLWKASQSTAHLTYLTMRPWTILIGMLLQTLWTFAQFLFRVLLEQAWISLGKGYVQLKHGLIALYRFQMGLSRVELIGEVAVILLSIGAYYLYKWMQRQTYWGRFVTWYSGQKEIVLEKTNKFIDHVARVSLILAMAIPHGAFLGGYVVLKILFPSIVKWLAYDTYSTSLISVWYPLLMTLAWIHETRSSSSVPAEEISDSNDENNSKNANRKKSSKSQNEKTKDSKRTLSTPRTGKRDRRNTPSKHSTSTPQKSSRKRITSVFSRTNPPTPETPVRRPKLQPKSPGLALFVNEPERATQYWLRYWMVYALVESLGTLGTIVPVFGTFVARHPYVLHVCCELKLVFFIWIFFMENLIGSTVKDEKALMAQTMPLRLMHDHVAPLILEVEAVVAESVSKDTWNILVISKMQRILELLVTIRMISESRKDWLLHILTEGRALLLPGLTLFMPGFITQFGVAYVQFLVPSAKSARALGSGRGKLRTRENKAKEILYLQYWVIHCLVSGLLAYFSTILWWIPFSTHGIFLLWCHLSFPKTVGQCYGLLEAELMAFGLLPGETEVRIHETKTVQALQAVYSRLPSAASSELVEDTDVPEQTDEPNEEDLSPQTPSKSDDEDDDEWLPVSKTSSTVTATTIESISSDAATAGAEPVRRTRKRSVVR